MLDEFWSLELIISMNQYDSLEVLGGFSEMEMKMVL